MSNTDTRFSIVIVGHGKLAEAISSNLPKHDQEDRLFKGFYTYNGQSNLPAPAILVHVGSGRQYQESLALAINHRFAFIQAATEKEIPLKPPTPGEIIFINAPNLDLRLIKLFHWLKLGADLFQDETISITESHQSTKLSDPGTAYKMCEILGIDHSMVTSIRDPEQQRALQIKTLEHHAYHQLVIGSSDSHIKIETKVEGSASYVAGLYEILKSVRNVPIGNYEVEALLVNGYL